MLAIKTNRVSYIFQQSKEILSEHLSSYQLVYVANLDDTTNFVTNECSKKIEFYCDREEADTKMLAFIKFLSTAVQLKRVILDLPHTDVDVISLYHYITNLALLDSIWFRTGTGNKKRFMAIHSLASEYDL